MGDEQVSSHLWADVSWGALAMKGIQHEDTRCSNVFRPKCLCSGTLRLP